MRSPCQPSPGALTRVPGGLTVVSIARLAPSNMKSICLLSVLLGIAGPGVAAEAPKSVDVQAVNLAPGMDPEIVLSRVLNRSLIDVKMAVQKFCEESKTIHATAVSKDGSKVDVVTSALFVIETKEVAGVSYAVRAADCTHSTIGVQVGEFTATSEGPGKTRLEFRAVPDAGNGRLRMEKALEKIATILNRPR